MSAIGQKPPTRPSFMNRLSGLFRNRTSTSTSDAASSRSSSQDSQDAYASDGRNRQSKDQGMSHGAQDMATALGANLKRKNATIGKNARLVGQPRSAQPAAKPTVQAQRPGLLQNESPQRGRPGARIAPQTMPSLSPLAALEAQLKGQLAAEKRSSAHAPVSDDDMDQWSKM